MIQSVAMVIVRLANEMIFSVLVFQDPKHELCLILTQIVQWVITGNALFDAEMGVVLLMGNFVIGV